MYGGGSALLMLNLFFLIKAIFSGNFIPVVPILAGILTAIGLLLIVFAEHRARLEDKRDHRRISRVAHQLESPLRALQDDFQYLVRHADQLPSEARLKLKNMETKSAVLLENIRDVFLTLQAQEGKVAGDRRTYDLCTLVKEAIERVRPLAAARNVEIITKQHCTDAPVKVDRRLFLVALVHLIENGVLYTLKPGLVNVAVTRGAHTARVLVQDRGVGITPEDEDVVFQPFARGAHASQFDPDGIGVGLTLARLIVREFGGDLVYHARQSATGSEFEIKLPLVKT